MSHQNKKKFAPMNKKLLLLNTRFLLFAFFMLTATISFGQITIFQFGFENSLNPNINNSCGTPSFEGRGISQPVYDGSFPCVGSFMLSASNWKNDEFYRITVNTSGYQNMILSYCNRGESGIGNFISYVSTDGGTTKVPIINSYIPSTANSTVTSIELPIAANNKGLIYLYIQKVGNANNGSLNFHVDDIKLVGTPIANGTVSSNATVCSGINSTNLRFSGSTAPITGWESSLDNFLTGGIAITNTTAELTVTNLTATTSFRAVTKSGTCPPRYSEAATVTVNTTVAPTASVQTFCSGATVSNLVATGTALKWYTAITGGATLVSTSALATGTYFVSQTLNSCESTRTSIAVTVNTTAAPLLGTRTQPTCSTATGSAIINGLPLGSWELTRSPGNVKTTGSGTSTTISGLSTGTYTYSVIGTSNGTGLKGEYFNNITLSGAPALTRTDATVGFNWGNGNPGTPITNDNFSVRWSGQIQPLYSQNYTFRTTSDDGIRLWINGIQIINNWTDHSVITNDSAPIALIAGVKYDIVLEYYENAGQAVSQLSWSSTSQQMGIIQQSQLYPDVLCSSPASANVVIDAQPVTPSAPLSALPTHPTCVVPTGSVVLSGLPTSVPWTITTTPVTSGLTGLTGTGDRTIVSGLTAGITYTFAVSNGTCISPVSSTVVIKPLPLVASYNGLWTNGPPTIEQSIVFSGNYISIGNMEGCDCTVNAGVKVTVQPGHTLKITNAVKVNTATGTSLTFENNASLVQINDVTNSGNITYKRVTVTGVRVTDYTYWSSPVSPLNLAGSTGGILYNPSTHIGSRFFSYLNSVASGAWQPELASKQMEVGKGYIIRGPNAIPIIPLTFLQATFVGVPNNGNIIVAGGIIANRPYLIGNPYPSAIDADKFLTANNSVLGGTLYFWTHNTPITNRFYTSDDYATYTLTGGVGTAVAISDPDKALTNPARPTGKIGAGQGFFASTIVAPTGTSIVFNNEMRTGLNGAPLNNSQFFRTSKTNSKTTTEVEKNRIWLNLTNSGGAFKQLLVGYITGATNEYDSSYDGNSFSANKYINFYSVLNSNLLTIQGRALPFDPSDLVPLGYVSTIVGELSISIDEVDGALKSQEVFMEDKMLDIVHDLKVAPYKFVTATGTFNDRFVLRYSNRTLNNENFDAKGNSIIVSKDKNELKVKSQLETIQRITIFNLLGKKVLDQDDINSNEFRSSNASVTNQTVIVKITLTTGIVISKKVAF